MKNIVKKYKKEITFGVLFTLLLYLGLFRFLPFLYILLIRIAIKKNNLGKIILAFFIPFIFFLPLNLWDELPKAWYLIPSLLTAISYTFFFITAPILFHLKLQNKTHFLLFKLILISLVWILIAKTLSTVTSTDFLWIFFSPYWYRLPTSKLGVYLSELIVFFIFGYYSLALKIRNTKDIIISSMLLIILLISILYYKPIKHDEKALLVNLNLRYNSRYRVEHQEEILNMYLEEIKNKITPNTSFVLLPEYIIVKEYKNKSVLLDKIRNLTYTLNVPVLIGSAEDYNKTHFYDSLIYIYKNTTKYMRDPFPMPLSKVTLPADHIYTIKIHNKTYAYLGCFSAYQTRFWKKIKENKTIDGIIISSNEQAANWFIKEAEYFGVRLLEAYTGKPVYKATNTGVNYPEEMSNTKPKHYLLAEIFH